MRAIVLFTCASCSSLSSPARADDVTAAQNIIRAQEQAFGRDDSAAAYSHAAPALQQVFRRPKSS